MKRTLAVLGDALLVGNCSSSREDKNLWSFTVRQRDWAIVLRDAVHLRACPNSSDEQIFNFCTRWGQLHDEPCFFASTEEGALWVGKVTGRGKIHVLGRRAISSRLGAAIAYNTRGILVAVGHNLYEYSTRDVEAYPLHSDPELLTDSRATTFAK